MCYNVCTVQYKLHNLIYRTVPKTVRGKLIQGTYVSTEWLAGIVPERGSRLREDLPVHYRKFKASWKCILDFTQGRFILKPLSTERQLVSSINSCFSSQIAKKDSLLS